MATNNEMTVQIHGSKVPLNQVKRYHFTAGPNLLDLITGYAYAYSDRRAKRPVHWIYFVQEDGRRIKTRIVGMKHESGNDSQHLLDVYVPGAERLDGSFVPEYRASGYYDIARRTGYFDVVCKGEDLAIY